MKKSKIKEEMEELFGEDFVRIALAQEFLARKYTMDHPIQVRNVLQEFIDKKNLKEQKEFVDTLDPEIKRAFICAFLCDSASQAVLDLASQAIKDQREGRPVLGGRIIQKK